MSDDGLDPAGRALEARVRELIARGPDAVVDAAERERLALDLFAWQREHCEAVDRVARAFAGPGAITALDALPGVPADAFKTARIACFPPERTVRCFHTSGTTREVRGRHEFADFSLYEAASLAAGARYLLPRPPYRFALLAETPAESPHSSLSFMLDLFARRFAPAAGEVAWGVRGGALDVDAVDALIARAQRDGAPVALLGATWAFVHYLEAPRAEGVSLALPPGSVVMPTGGFKGRAREIPARELFELLGLRFGVARAQIVQEYGMTELSSQAYEAHGDGVPPGQYVAPPWMIVTAVDPESLAPLPDGAPGILRLIDLANVGSCVAVQTADVGVTRGAVFEVHGRAPGATPRGCARAMDALLSGGEGNGG